MSIKETIKELKERLESYVEGRIVMRGELVELFELSEKLEAEVEKLEQDKEMLDYIDKNKHNVEWDENFVLIDNNLNIISEADNIRDLIRQTMKGDKG